MPRFSDLFRFSQQEIKQTFSKATSRKKVGGLEFVIAPASHEIGRLLIVTPRAIGTAPERNLLRRRIKSIFYEDQLFNNPFDIIILAKKGSVSISFEELKTILHTVIQKKDD